MLARLAKVSNRKVSDHSDLKTLSPMQMLQRLPIALAQVRSGNTSENFLIKSDKSYIFSLEQKKLLKKYR